MWLKEIRELFMIEYRHFNTSNSMNTEADQLMGPEGLDWPGLTNEVHAQINQQLTTSCDAIVSAHVKRMTETGLTL